MTTILGFLALATFASCAVLPVIGHMSYLHRTRRNRNERP